jgi:hypothetical protein
MADAVILLVLALALYWGLRRGLIRPLVSEAIFVFALLVTGLLHRQVEGLLPQVPAIFISPVMVLVISLALGVLVRPLVTMIRLIPFVGMLDTWLGVVVHGAIAFTLVYLFVGAVIDFDGYVYPVLRTGVVTAHDIQRYRQAVAANPALKPYANDDQARQAQALATIHPLPLSAVRQVADALDFYVRYLRDPLVQSHVAPIINEMGSRLPFIGHHRDYLRGGTCVPACDNQPAP